MNFREFDQQSVFSGKFYTFSVKCSVFIRMFRGFFPESCPKLSKIVQIGKKGVFSAESPVTILYHFLPIFAQNALYALFNPKTRPWKFRKKPEKKGLSSIDRRNHFFGKIGKRDTCRNITKKCRYKISIYGLFKPKITKKMSRKFFEKNVEKRGLSSIDRRNHFFNKLKKSAFFAIFIKWKISVFYSFRANLILSAHFDHFWKKWVYHR